VLNKISMKITDSKEILWKKIKFVESTLKKQSRWYTGISIKKYLTENIFNLQAKTLQNRAINAGRWSAYAHYSQLSAFQNLLDKNNIKFGSKVLVHPLLPKFLIEELLNRQVEILTLDIQKNNFNFNPKNFTKLLNTQQETNFLLELVIHYGFNGLYFDLVEMLNLSQKKGIPSIVIIDNPNLSLDLFKVFEAVTLGGILWNFGDSFLDDQLNTVLDVDLKSQIWFVSWQIETRTRTILEYHLKKSYSSYLPLIEAFFYLLLDEYKQRSWIGGVYQTIWNFLLLRNKFTNQEKALKSIKSSYNQIFDLAVCDLFFELQLEFPIKIEKYLNNEQLSHQNNQVAVASRQIYNFFLKTLESQPKGSLEIPTFYLDKTYLKYFIFTTKPDFWYKTLRPKGLEIQILPKLPSIFDQNQDLKIAKFVTKLGFLIDIPASIQNSINLQPKNLTTK
jgi:hypothetical protein